MTMRLQEVHPSLVHYPIAFLPLAIGADAVGKLTGSKTLLATGKLGIALTAVTGALAGVAGLIAQEEVELRTPRADDMLVTHRTLNVAVVGIATAMAVIRARREKPTFRYLAAGIASIGAMAYSAYLGGKMVYEQGVGVEPAGGIAEGHGPELRWDRAEELTEHALEDVREGIRHAAQTVAEGKFVPTLMGEPERPGGAGATAPRAADGGEP
ncbi:MAG TPA: DUF2231 domain-containing protein [Longimicrobiales bacterium]